MMWDIVLSEMCNTFDVSIIVHIKGQYSSHAISLFDVFSNQYNLGVKLRVKLGMLTFRVLFEDDGNRAVVATVAG